MLSAVASQPVFPCRPRRPAIRAVAQLDSVMGQDGFDRDLGLVEDLIRPAETEELRLRQCQQQVSLQRAGKRACVDQRSETIGEHELQVLRIHLGQLGKSSAPLGVSRFLVGKEVLRLDPAMTAHGHVFDIALLQEGYKERA